MREVKITKGKRRRVLAQHGPYCFWCDVRLYTHEELLIRFYGIRWTKGNAAEFVDRRTKVDPEFMEFWKKRSITMDHLVRRADGGSNADDNLVPACRPCNSERHKKKWKPNSNARNADIKKRIQW